MARVQGTLGLRRDRDGILSTTPANLIANRIFIKKDTPYSFDDRPFMAAIFDDGHTHVLAKTARQVSKSTTIAGRILINTEGHSPYVSLFLSPSYGQTATFSHQRLGPTIKQSPHIQIRMDRDCLDNVLQKEFIDGSMILLSYAKENADRVRGISVDEINFDEVQDMHLEAVEPVVRESLFTSKYQRRFYSGTPKSMNNGIEKLWRESDQRMWMVACRHHSPVFHQPLMPENVGKEGVICSRKGCRRPLNTLDGLWVRTVTRKNNGEVPHVHGYHIPQIIFPTRTTRLPSGGFGFLNWQDFLLNLNDPNADDATIKNEKFGLSADNATKPISEERLMTLCNDSRSMPKEYNSDYMTGTYTYAGVDWGQGQGSSTVLTIGQFDPRNPGIFKILYVRRFDGMDADPTACVPEIMATCSRFRVKRMHADFGGGFGINDGIFADRGDEFLTTNYWSNSISAALSNYDQRLNRFVLNRSVTISKFFLALKTASIQVDFKWSEYKQFSVDILNVFREERKNGDPYYDHNEGTQDDAMHSHIYCWLVACWDRISGDFVADARAHGYTHNPTMN